ncbi:hypothetical protein LMG33818_000483 [Halomonadaceae bacterium LMG 33818]|uniref:histone-like nucleoid-structuring protein, MvaT/MvaU family n=1 Tax=Cernens ardua TaxID=3402176 RepID=UPI003EDC4D84
MSGLKEYKQLEIRARELEETIAQLSQDERLKKEMAFSSHLRALMEEFDKSTDDVLALFEVPDTVATETSAATSDEEKSTSRQRKKRKLKTYKNPHTGEVIETRGGNHTVLKAWKKEYGNETVETWLQ